MTASTQTFTKMPSVLSFKRSLLVSDAAFYNLIDGEYEPHPVIVMRHGIRGTQNVNDSGNSAKGTKARDPANIQQTETAKLDPRAECLVVTMGLRMLNLHDALFACASDDAKLTADVRESIENFVQRAKGKEAVLEVARRITRNLANGSWLWRNRSDASRISVVVNAGEQEFTFEALDIPVNNFDHYSDDERAVADFLVRGLYGERSANVKVKAYVWFGVTGAVEVYPSQAYLEGKPKGFARPLYKLPLPGLEKPSNTDSIRPVGQAALRDQKISNRLKTIDTWYPGFETVGKALPVEPNGASLELMNFFRNDKKNSAYALMARLNAIQPDSTDAMFVIASMIRGGVFASKSDKVAGGEADAAEGADSAVEEV